jgi:protein-S-isoprenylcysteine O-methyltransferase Ste14
MAAEQLEDRYHELLPGLLNLLSATVVLVLSFFVESSFPLAKTTGKPLGIVLVALGMALVLWAAFHLKSAFLGEVEPRRDELVTGGPYRFVRHPVYLGMTIALAGVPVSLTSAPGLAAVLALFLPSELYRARLEERALERRFGEVWRRYASRTGFLLPRFGKAGGPSGQP